MTMTIILKKAGLVKCSTPSLILSSEGQQSSYIRTFPFKQRKWLLIKMGDLSLLLV